MDFLRPATELFRQRDPKATLRGCEVPHQGLAFLYVATDFSSRPGAGFDQSAPGQNRRQNAFRPEKWMRLNLHRSAQAEVVILRDYSFGVQNSANRLDRFTLRRARQQLRNTGQIDPQVKSGARHIRLVIEFAAVVTFGARVIVELHSKRTAVDCASIPDEINPFGNGCIHFRYTERNCRLHRKPPGSRDLWLDHVLPGIPLHHPDLATDRAENAKPRTTVQSLEKIYHLSPYSGCLALRHQFRGTDGPFRNNEGRRRMSRMSAFLLPSFNMFYILACGAIAWFAVRRHLLR